MTINPPPYVATFELGDQMKHKCAETVADSAKSVDHRFSLSRSSVSLIYAVVIVAIISVSFTVVDSTIRQNANADAIDGSVKPGDDFYRYANGGWLKSA